MEVARTVRVRCGNRQCPKPADTSVPVERVAAGVLARPHLVCEACGHELVEVSGA